MLKSLSSTHKKHISEGLRRHYLEKAKMGIKKGKKMSLSRRLRQKKAVLVSLIEKKKQGNGDKATDREIKKLTKDIRRLSLPH